MHAAEDSLRSSMPNMQFEAIHLKMLDLRLKEFSKQGSMRSQACHCFRGRMLCQSSLNHWRGSCLLCLVSNASIHGGNLQLAHD